MTARLYIGDVHDRMRELDDASYDLIITSPPFLAQRDYLPADHPLKHLEIGSEATPAAFLDVMLALTAEWGRLLAPHGSIAIELGDKYAGSGGAGGDYDDDGLRAGQPRFNGVGGPGWPLDQSMCMLPTLYAACLAYGHNLLTGQPSPAGRWMVRNVKPWIRSNPPVGALGKKERPATSYVTVATRAVDRYFDLDAVRTAPVTNLPRARGNNVKGSDDNSHRFADRVNDNGGAPPLDWWHQVDALIDNIIDEKASTQEGQRVTFKRDNEKHRENGQTFGNIDGPYDGVRPGARGVHIRRALETAGYIQTLDALDVSPKGYAGAHYAVWPPLLVKLLLQEMCPRRVCTVCGKPSRRITEQTEQYAAYRQEMNAAGTDIDAGAWEQAAAAIGGTRARAFTGKAGADSPARGEKHRTVGWSDCGHNTWRPARILDPFAGSGTTLAVATGMGYEADGIDIDERNADLARERVGMFLEIIERAPEGAA